MNTLHNLQIPGFNGRPILLDVFIPPEIYWPAPLVIFSHGFKGFKDWGHFNELGRRFSAEGLVFIKFNFSHNGVTAQDLLNITDLETFGRNNYTIELYDLQEVIDWAFTAGELAEIGDTKKLCLMGHSRGGGISIIKAAEDPRVKKLVTWASVSDLVNRNKKKTIETWQREGVIFAENRRTGQKLPLYFQFYEDILQNTERFNIVKALHRLEIPVLVVHGTEDEAVPVQEAETIRRAARQAQLVLVEGGTHTFGISHPFSEGPFPGNAELVIFKTLEFLKLPF